MPSAAFHRQCIHVASIQTDRHTHINKNKSKKSWEEKYTVYHFQEYEKTLKAYPSHPENRMSPRW